MKYLYGDSILNRWKDYFSQLLIVYRVSDSSHIEMHAAEALIIDPSPCEAEIAIAILESYTSPDIDQIPAEPVRIGGQTLWS
jgi:hypothetical protein